MSNASPAVGTMENLNYQQQGENIENNKYIMKNRKRNIIWFNPPCSKSLKTNIGKYFFRLLNKHFPQYVRYRQVPAL